MSTTKKIKDASTTNNGESKMDMYLRNIRAAEEKQEKQRQRSINQLIENGTPQNGESKMDMYRRNIKKAEEEEESKKNAVVTVPITDKKSVSLKYGTVKAIDDFVRSNKDKNKYKKAKKLDDMIDGLNLSDDEKKSAMSYAGLRKLSFGKDNKNSSKFVQAIKNIAAPAVYAGAGVLKSALSTKNFLLDSVLGTNDTYNDEKERIKKYYAENPDELGNDLYGKDTVDVIGKDGKKTSVPKFNEAGKDYMRSERLNNTLSLYDDINPVVKFISEAGFESAGQMLGSMGTAGLGGLPQMVSGAGSIINKAASATKAGQAVSKVLNASPKIGTVAGEGIKAKAANAAIGKINSISAGSALKFLNPLDNPTTAVMGINSIQDKYEQLRGMGYDSEKAKANALFTGYVNAVTEKMGYDGTPQSQIILKGNADDAAKAALKGTKNAVKNSAKTVNAASTASKGLNIKNALKTYLVQNISEGAEEIYATVFERAGDYISKVGYVDDDGKIKQRTFFGNDGVIDPKAIGESFAGGLVGGAVMGGVGVLGRIVNNDAKTVHEYADTVKRQTDNVNNIISEVSKKAGVDDIELPKAPDWKRASAEEIGTYLNDSLISYNKLLNDERVKAYDENELQKIANKSASAKQEVTDTSQSTESPQNINQNTEDFSKNTFTDELDEIAASDKIISFAPDNASVDVKNIEKTLIEKGAPDINRQSIVNTMQSIEPTVQSAGRSVKEASVGASKITNNAISDISKTAGKSSYYWPLYETNLKALTDISENVESEDFIRSYANAYADGLSTSKSAIYKELSKNGADAGSVLADYILYQRGTSGIDANAIIKAANMLSPIIHNAASNINNAKKLFYKNLPSSNVSKNISLTKVGDFYEAYGEDAIDIANKLNLMPVEKVVDGEKVKMVGFPIQALESYKNILGSDYNIAINNEASNDTAVRKTPKTNISEENTAENTAKALSNDENRKNSENTVLPNEPKRDTISADNNEKGAVENADIRGDREETPQRSQADEGGNDTSDSLSLLERQAGKGTGEVQERSDRADTEGRGYNSGGKTDIERRTLKDVCGLKEFEKLKNTVDSELTVTALNELRKKYAEDPRINGEDIVYDASDVCVYDMLTNTDNELRELFSDNVAEYFNTDKDSSKDITGQSVPEHILESTENSVVKNENGQLIPVYHGTGENFVSFKRSDIGIHFGSYAQAVQRVNDKGIENPRYIRAYLNITNPIEIDEDFFGWNAFQIVQKLAKIGIIEQSEGVGYLTSSKENLEKSNDELCELLKSKGYDGIVYNNRVEAAQGRSYIVFDNSQVFETEGKETNSFGADENTTYHTTPAEGMKLVYTIDSIVYGGKKLVTGVFELNSDKDFKRRALRNESYNIFFRGKPYVRNVKGKIFGHYGVHKLADGKYMVSHLPSGLGLKKYDTLKAACDMMKFLDDEYPDADISITAYGDDGYRSKMSEDVIKKMQDILSAGVNAQENTEITLPLKNKKQLIAYLNTHIGDSISASFDGGKTEEIRKIVSASDRNIVFELPDGSKSTLQAKASEISYTDTGFEFNDGRITITYNFVNESKENKTNNPNYEENIKEEQDNVRREVLDGENGGYDERDISRSVSQAEEVGRASGTDRNDSTLGNEGVREHDGLGKREQTSQRQHTGGNIDNELGKSDSGKRSGTGENELSFDVTGVNSTSEEAQNPSKKAQKNNTGNYVLSNDIDAIRPNEADNIAAIEVLKELEEMGAKPTAEQRDILAKYKGFGGLKDVFLSPYKEQRLKKLLNEKEFKSAKSTINDAFYTPTKVIDAMYKGLKRMGFKGGTVLEPAMGSGNFFGRMPKSMSALSRLYGVEIDPITSRIAALLYPDADIKNSGFEDAGFKEGAFDLVIGNVPFSEVSYKYKNGKYSLHDYFFIKSLDLTADNGICAFLTSTGTLDKINPKARNEIMKRADVIAAYRLPGGTFSQNAATDVTTDLIILKKRAADAEPAGESIESIGNIDGTPINEYYERHPENILGELVYQTNQYGKMSSSVKGDGNFYELLNKAMNRLPKDLLLGKTQLSPLSVEISENEKPHFADIDGRVVFIDPKNKKPVEFSGKKAQRAQGYIKIKDIYNSLLDAASNKENTAQLRKELNTAYDSFVKSFGSLQSGANRFLGEDSEFVRVSGLELYNPKTKKYVKSDIFTKDTIGYEPPKSADSAHDALAISINETGSIDFNRMTSLTGKSKEDLCKELDDKIILTPDGNYELIDVYLSGNVREKYEAVKGKQGFEKNAKLLRAVVPKDKTAAEIKPQLGASWIDKKYVAQFMHETFETYSLPEINYDKTTGTWTVGNNTFGNRQLTTVKYGTARANAMYLTERTLNMKQANVYDKIGDSRILNKKETKLARQKQQEIKAAFEDWVFKDKTRRDELTKTYNRLFNSNRNMQYDSLAQYITFPGLSDTFKLRDYQKAAVARVVFGKNTLLAHGVGTGKTAEMIASAMELKRMGIVKKNMMIVPKHKVGDFRSDILTMYPNAKVLMATEKDFEKAKRAKLFSKIASNDWDIVVIGHTSFNKIPVKSQTQAAFIENEIADLESVIKAARAESGKKQDTRFISSLEKTKKAKEVQLKSLLDAPKDDTLAFEEMGIDSVFVDEAHNFKNLPFYTKLNVPGIKSGTAKRAQDLYMKTNYLRDRDGRVTFATATPITNTISELYNMTRYLRPDLLRDSGIYSFDGWASTFGTIETKIEISPDGRSFRTKERFSKYHNVPEMIGMTRMFMDVLKTSDVIQDLPKAEYIDVTSPATDIHDKYVEEITERIKSISSKGQSSGDNMLLVTNDGRAMATDLRLVSSQLGEYSSSELDVPESKINKCVRNIIKEYSDSNASKGVQFVFLDFGIKEDKDARYGYNLYNDIINKLTAAGIDKSQIAKIGDYNTTAKKDALFEALNKGEIRILIGSTAKMGEGMNAQKKAVALHHLNAPYRPSDIEQREGRIIRYGNENKNVRIYRYIQEKSFDSYMWQMLARKAEFINQAMSDGNVSELEETDDFVLSAKTGMAIATGNPLIMEKVEIDEEVNRLMLLQKSYKAERFYMEDRLSKLPAQIESLKNVVQKVKNDAAKVKKQDKLSITIGKSTYEKRTDAGKALEKLIKNAPKNGKKVHVGSYMGFELSYSGSIETGQKLIIDGDYDYSVTLGQSSEGDITRIINAVEKIPGYFAEKRTILANYEAELKTIRADMGKEFKYQSELDTALAKQAELNAALNMGNDDTQDMSDIIEEMDSDFEDGDEEDSDSTVHSSRDIDDYEYENYTYKALTEKDDMIVTLLDTKEIYDDNGKLNRAEIINKGLENVRRKGNAKNTNQNVYVYIPDIDRNVLVGKRGLSHGLTRNAEATARVTLNIGDILENAIRVNELKPRNNSKGGYVLLGIATDADNNYYPTRIVVNNHSVDEIEVLDVLYAVNAKKKNQSSNEAELPANAVPPIKGSSTISIPDLLAIVKNDFSDVLSDDVLSNLGVQRKKSTLSDSIKYSKDTADTDITSRWTAKPVEDGKANIIDRAKNIVKKDDVNIADIVKNISDKFGIPIATGKVTDPKASGIYKDKPETIRVRITNNLPTISHELGHHIDKKYRFSKLESVKALRKAVSEDFLDNYPEKERNSEAVAEFVRVYLANKNNAQRMCKAFWSDFVNTLSKEDLKALNSIASSVNKYMSYNLSQRYDAAIVSSQKKEKLPFRERWSKWYSDWVDAFHPQKEVMDYVEDITGKSLSGKNNAYVLATNSLNAHTVANFLICEGFRDLNGNIVNAKSFVDSIGMVDAKNIKLLDRYLVLRHSLEWIAPEQEDVTAKRVFADATLEDVDSIKKEISEIEKEYPEIKTAAENLYKYQDNVIKHFVIPSGGMTEDMLASLNRKYPCYVPFYRAVGKQSGTAKGTFANQRIPIARAKGSGALIISPTASIIRNTEKMVKFALRNQVMSIWADYADTVDGFGQFMEKVAPDQIPHFTDITSQKEQFADALQGVISSGKDYFAVSDLLDEIFGDAVMDFTPVANANKKIVTVLKNGKPSYYQIHNDAFYNSVAELSPQQTTGLLNIMDKIMQPMKLLITQNNPIFAATNAVRDFGTAYKLSEINNPVTFAGQYVKALSEIITNSKSYKQYKAMGGGHSSELSANIDDIAKTLRTVAQKDMGKARRLAYSIFRHPVETVATINDAVESIPRFMEFQRTLKSGGDFQEAIFNADDITTNFKRSGKGDTAKALNKMIMFNNAAIQGVDKTFRTLTEKDPKKRYKTLLKWLLNALIMGIIGYFYNKEVDEDGYKNLSSYKKNNFYNFAIGDGNFISLPKPRENALLDTFTERTIEYIFGDNENAFYDFGSYLASQLLPPMLPDKLNPIDAVHSVLGNTVIGGLTDIGFNKDFKGTPIESKYDEYLPSNERYTENTSKAAYALGQTKLARYWDMSPKKIDHLISSYTGVLGQVNKALFPMSDSRRDKTIGLRNKFISDSNYSTDVLNRMYDNEEKAKKAFDYSGTIDNAVEYEQNAIITSYISGMLKAIKALPEDKQRNGRAYLLKALDHWNYNTTDSQRQMIRRIKDDTVSENCIITSVPKSSLEWTEKGVKYYYQMTPSEYNSYVKDYLKAVEQQRADKNKYNTQTEDYTSELSTVNKEVLKELSPVYKLKYRDKAQKLEK